jgi:hypothetical protein
LEAHLKGDVMPNREFFARLEPEFSEHAVSARESASRQADVERLITKAEYECYQVRRELAAVMAGIAVSVPDAGAVAVALAGADEAILRDAVDEPARAA